MKSLGGVERQFGNSVPAIQVGGQSIFPALPLDANRASLRFAIGKHFDMRAIDAFETAQTIPDF